MWFSDVQTTQLPPTKDKKRKRDSDSDHIDGKTKHRILAVPRVAHPSRIPHLNNSPTRPPKDLHTQPNSQFAKIKNDTTLEMYFKYDNRDAVIAWIDGTSELEEPMIDQ
jgi:hypothetical protein